MRVLLDGDHFTKSEQDSERALSCKDVFISSEIKRQSSDIILHSTSSIQINDISMTYKLILAIEHTSTAINDVIAIQNDTLAMSLTLISAPFSFYSTLFCESAGSKL